MNPRPLMPFLLLSVACSGGSTEPPAPAASAPPATTMAAAPLPMGTAFEAEIVMLDAAAPSLTLRQGDVPATSSPRPGDLKTGDRTIRVEPAAAGGLATLKPGLRVRVTCSAPPTVVDPPPAMMASASPAGPASAMPGGPLGQCGSIAAVTALEAAPAR